LGITFLNGAFLFAALAALLPLVIHLISRRRMSTVDFSSLRFLKELERRRVRRVRLRQILLLVIRSLIILSVALALARPTLTGALSAGAGRARTSMAIVLDNSASMDRSVEGGDLLAGARERVGDLAGVFDEGDQAFLVTAGMPVRSVLPGGTFGREALLTAAETVTAGPGGTDYGRAVQVARELLGEARNLNHELYIVGDMQRTGWEREERSAAEESGPPDGDAPVYLLPLSGPVANLAIRSVDVERRYGGAEGTFSVGASVAAFGHQGGAVEVRLFVDGRQAGQAGVRLEPGGTAAARFAVRLDESVWHSGFVELPPDALMSDNRRHFVVPPSRETEVLIVGDETGDGDSYYADMALDPTGEGARFSTSLVSSDDLSGQDHGRFPVVVLADVSRLAVGASQWLERHVREGGGLLAVVGDRTDVRFWNAGVLSRLTGVEIVAPVEGREGLRLAPAVRGHPLLDGLAFGERMIDEVSVRRAIAVLAEGAEVVLELPGVGPALLFGGGDTGGDVAVLTTGLDPDWSDLPRSGLAVPLVHRVCERLGHGVAGEGAGLVGDDLAVELGATPSGPVEVVLPDGATALAELRASGRPVAVVKDAPLPGVYEFLSDGDAVALGVVNADAPESDLAAASVDEIEEWLAPARVREIVEGGRLEEEITVARRGRELWRAFLYAALCLVALEMFVARPR
jgi:hypothetical protein